MFLCYGSWTVRRYWLCFSRYARLREVHNSCWLVSFNTVIHEGDDFTPVAVADSSFWNANLRDVSNFSSFLCSLFEFSWQIGPRYRNLGVWSGWWLRHPWVNLVMWACFRSASLSQVEPQQKLSFCSKVLIVETVLIAHQHNWIKDYICLHELSNNEYLLRIKSERHTYYNFPIIQAKKVQLTRN